MKSFFIFLISLPLIFSIFSCGQATAGDNAKSEATEISEKVDVYYFHFERRCITCIEVQQATEKVLSELFQEDMDNSKLTYHEVNLSEPESREIAHILDVGGQALLVVNGRKKYDITMQGFMYASRDYERFKATLNEAISKVKS